MADAAPSDRGRPDLDQGLAAVVLSGGGARRFGRDKLAEPVGDHDLLGAAVAELPIGTDVILVGHRGLGRAGVRTVREEPPGGGPGAGLVRGLRAALERADVAAVVTLPGDAPLAGRAARRLLGRLDRDPTLDAVLGVDPDGREQPLQLALRPAAARALIEVAGVSGGAGASVRGLVHALDVRPAHERLTFAETFDIDTPGQLAAWRAQDSEPVRRVLAAVTAARQRQEGPVVVALDGPSGTGKSTLGAALQLVTDGVLVAGDDFYSSRFAQRPVAGYDGWSGAELAATVIDWTRLRSEALAPLAAGRPATYQPFDWRAGDGRLGRPVHREPQPVVIVEGVYAARPELVDLVTVSVLVEVDPARRAERLSGRGDDQPWARLWDRAERHYFTQVRRPDTYDLRVVSETGDGRPGPG